MHNVLTYRTIVTQAHWHVKELEKERVLSAPGIQGAASSGEEGSRTTLFIP
jgi:hypothetical protein